MSVCTYVRVHLYGRVHTCMDVCTLVWTCAHLYGRVHICMDVCTLVWTCAHLYGRVRTCMDVCTLVCIDKSQIFNVTFDKARLY